MEKPSYLPDGLTHPQLLFNQTAAVRNITRMAEKAAQSGVTLRPHFKTHQSAKIAELFREAGVEMGAVSSISMLEYFLDAGWGDLLLAIPAIPAWADALTQLSDKADRLGIFVNNPETARALDDQVHTSLDAYIEIDTGQHRSGLNPDDTAKINSLVGTIRDSHFLNFRGFYSHPGQTYQAGSRKDIEAIHDHAVRQLTGLRDHLEGIPNRNALDLVIGDTPSCSAKRKFSGISTVSPGNFVFFDLQQYALGACELSDIAVAVAVPVIDLDNQNKRLIAHGGAVHLSKDTATLPNIKQPIYGLPVLLEEYGWSHPIPGATVHSLSQEHAVIHYPFSSPETPDLKPGDWIGILPAHSCLAVHQFSQYRNLQGEKISKMAPG